jgi:hypothetical protein
LPAAAFPAAFAFLAMIVVPPARNPKMLSDPIGNCKDQPVALVKAAESESAGRGSAPSLANRIALRGIQVK